MATAPSFRRCLRVQFDVLGALLLREVLTRFGRHNIGFLWLFAEPALFTLGVTGIWMATKMHHSSTVPVAGFAVSGYSTLLLWRNCISRSISAIEPNKTLLFHRQVRVQDLFFARILLEIAGATMSFVILTTVLDLFNFGGMFWPPDILLVIAGWVLLAWFSAALAIVLGALAAKTELIERTWHIIAYLILPFSGVFYMVDWLPKQLQEIVLYIPIVHAVEMVRGGFFGDGVRVHYDVQYLALSALVTSLFGLSLLRKVSREVELS